MTEEYCLMTEQPRTVLTVEPANTRGKILVSIVCADCDNAGSMACEVDIADLHKVLRKISMF
jgi:hypothetical protein